MRPTIQMSPRYKMKMRWMVHVFHKITPLSSRDSFFPAEHRLSLVIKFLKIKMLLTKRRYVGILWVHRCISNRTYLLLPDGAEDKYRLTTGGVQSFQLHHIRISNGASHSCQAINMPTTSFICLCEKSSTGLWPEVRLGGQGLGHKCIRSGKKRGQV